MMCTKHSSGVAVSNHVTCALAVTLIKRLLGHRRTDPAVQKILKTLPFRIDHDRDEIHIEGCRLLQDSHSNLTTPLHTT